jgi:organic hydroperoxide reductase OsmC/OhrA
MDGNGELEAGTGAFSVPVSFPRRVGEPEGVTSPEELIASAHATCYAMVVAGALAKNGAATRSTKVTCTITADKTEAGIKIARSLLEVVACRTPSAVLSRSKSRRQSRSLRPKAQEREPRAQSRKPRASPASF